jgi:hypothetical protein
MRLVRNLALLWFLLSLAGLMGAGMLLVYGMVSGCVGTGAWGACVAGSAIAIVAAIASLFMSTVAMFFSQMFYMAGARASRDGPLGRPSVRGFFADLIADVLT